MSTTANRRPRAETCQRLTLADLRPLVEPGTDRHQLADGTQLALSWAGVHGCWGGKQGQALLMHCPGCDAACRVLRRPPGGGWRCWRCNPLSHRSHRRSGSRRGRPKPTSWRLEQIEAEQLRIARLLGLQWPPRLLLWTAANLAEAPQRPDAPRLRRRRRLALLQRIDGLETMRVALIAPVINADLEALGGEGVAWPGMAALVARAEQQVADTGWAMRRTASDARTGRQQKPKPIAPQ